MSLCGTSTARIPTALAPEMSSYGRSPTNTQADGSSTPTARIAEWNDSGCGFV
jgi:hypothetical protein